MSKSYKSISNKYIDSTSVVHNRKLLSDLLDVKYISSHGWSLSVSTTSDCYADIQFSFNGWGYAGGELAFKVKCSSGEIITQQVARTTGHDTQPSPMTARSIFKLTKNNTYTFDLDVIKGALGIDRDTSWIGILIKY